MDLEYKLETIKKKKLFFKQNNFFFSFDKPSDNDIQKYYFFYYSLVKDDQELFNLDFDLLQDDLNIFMIKINNFDTMRFFGENRGWCVSDTFRNSIHKTQRTFERYLKYGFTYFIFNKNIKKGNQRSLLLYLTRQDKKPRFTAEFNWTPKNYDGNLFDYLTSINVDIDKIKFKYI